MGDSWGLGAHTTLVLSPWVLTQPCVQRQLPGSSPPRALECRAQPAASVTSCGKAVPAPGWHTPSGLGRTRSLQAAPHGQPAAVHTSAHTHTFTPCPRTGTRGSECGGGTASATCLAQQEHSHTLARVYTHRRAHTRAHTHTLTQGREYSSKMCAHTHTHTQSHSRR